MLHMQFNNIDHSFQLCEDSLFKILHVTREPISDAEQIQMAVSP